ncbi:uncharacterized protein K02A2.6-like [Hydractinia symbiolongicarpus]|uniref:uncharacterized protein K02A2.6-like n=1 Tax=Hydractinia symbiolongicarpus TaxID=13093 RepID=UPI0025503F90|nr:uncharacterized protein K02A2.6-like [Hydractinia symbiolongicarpus]
MRILVDLIESGITGNREDLSPHLQIYHQYRDHLSTVDGVALYKDRVIVPKCLRSNILSSLHAAHHGVTSMTLRAESSVFWPGLTSDIIKLRQGCKSCDHIAPSQQSAPPTPLNYPDYPFQQLCGDFFHYAGHNYLVCVDRYSNCPIVEEARNGASVLIDCLRRTFVTYGIPDEFASDGGGGAELCASSTSTFLRNWGVHHRVSSVAYPHSNCRAEVGVKTVKRMLMDNVGPSGNLDTDSFQRAMLQYRNTPNQTTKLSPAAWRTISPTTSPMIPVKPSDRDIDDSSHSADQPRLSKSPPPPAEHVATRKPVFEEGTSTALQSDKSPRIDLPLPTSPLPSIRRSTREHRQPAYLQDFNMN